MRLGRESHLMMTRKLAYSSYEPCSPIAVYAVVEKTKKKNKGNTNGVTRLTSTATDKIEVK